MSWIFADILEFLSTPVSDASVHLYVTNWMGTQAFISASGEWTPLPMWASDPTVDPENWMAYSYCDTAEDTKQTVHIITSFG